MDTSERTYRMGELNMNIAELREIKGISREELANCIGVSLITIGRYERGERKPAAEIIPKYAKALGVTADELLEAMLERKGA